MEKGKNVLAIDLGASSGRAILGNYDGERIRLEELHRFLNEPVQLNQTLYWDVLRLMHDIKIGLQKASKVTFHSVGIDTWGVDFGLLDEDGNLLENPVHYRDKRTEGMFELAFSMYDKERFYELSGNQFMEINTVFQLLSLKNSRHALLSRAKTLLLMPDLLNYFLTGVKASEYTIASTTQMLNAREKVWSEEIIQSLGLPESILTKIIEPGTVLSPIRTEILDELMIKPANVVAVAGHDTQCAMVAVPAKEEDFLFLSCGTWSLFGTELKEPLISEKSKQYNMTNEGGYGGKISFLKNIIGLWLIQESRRQWAREGINYTFSELENESQKAAPFKVFIDPDAPEFVAPGNIPERIRDYCKRTNQEAPKEIGEYVRLINECLALKYRYVMEQIEDCTQKSYDTIYLVGGGSKSRLLCQMTANACKKKVVAGPAEATVYGNIALQLIALGEISDLTKARECIRNSEDMVCYVPQEEDKWEEAYQRFLTHVGFYN